MKIIRNSKEAKNTLRITNAAINLAILDCELKFTTDYPTQFKDFDLTNISKIKNLDISDSEKIHILTHALQFIADAEKSGEIQATDGYFLTAQERKAAGGIVENYELEEI